MADAQPEDKPKRQPQRKGVRIDAPGFEGEVSEDTAQTFLDYTGRRGCGWSSPWLCRSLFSRFVWGCHG
jgi:hypothetical protein